MSRTTTPRRTATTARTRLGLVALATVVALGGTAAVTAPSTAAATAPSTAADAAATTPASPSPTAAANARLVGPWLDLWNGDPSQADALISPDFHVHAAMLDGGDGSAVQGPEGLVAWVSQIRAAIPDLVFSVEVGPIAEGDQVAVRWLAEGTYAGGIPGAQAPVGTPVAFAGTDILRVEDGQLAEYWVNSDTLLLLTQLQVQAG